MSRGQVAVNPVVILATAAPSSPLFYAVGEICAKPLWKKRLVDTHPNHKIMIKSGAPAPDFRLQNSDGSLFTLSDGVRGGSVALIFYRGDW